MASCDRFLRAGLIAIAARDTHLRSMFTGLLTLIIVSVGFAQQPHTLTGDVRLHEDFHSQVLNNNRDIIIYLPPGYDFDLKRRYPVLYFHDGQHLSNGATSYIPGQEWRSDQTPQPLITTHQIHPL